MKGAYLWLHRALQPLLVAVAVLLSPLVVLVRGVTLPYLGLDVKTLRAVVGTALIVLAVLPSRPVSGALETALPWYLWPLLTLLHAILGPVVLLTGTRRVLRAALLAAVLVLAIVAATLTLSGNQVGAAALALLTGCALGAYWRVPRGEE